jgi:hypothetical protein
MILGACLCALLTLPVAWHARRRISTDGLSYLEVATTTLQHGLHPLLANAYWSPAYPALIAAALKLTHPPLENELPIIHALDWMICFGTYLAFTYFLYGFLRWVQLMRRDIFGGQAGFLGFLAFAYTLLLVSNMDQTLWYVGPNILMEGCVYLAMGVCVRLCLPDPRYYRHLLLGLVLALGYTAKAALFPVAAVLLAILLVRPFSRAGRKGVALAAVSFLLATAPFVAYLSHSKQRFTLGDAGAINYAWNVNDIPHSIIWEDRLAGSAHLVHPAVKIFAHPNILKFEGPFRVTLPYWYDPSWWYDGLRPRFNLRQQITQYLRTLGLARNGALAGESFIKLAERWLPLWPGLLAFAVLAARRHPTARPITRQAWLYLWPLSGCLMFATVLVVYRYVFVFLVVGWTVLFVAEWLVTSPDRSLAITLTIAGGLAFTAFPDFAREVMQDRRWPATWTDRAVAGQLAALGIRPGDQIASAGWPDGSYIMRLAGARITMQFAENEIDALPELPAARVQEVLATLRANGARAVISSWRPAFQNDSGWVLLTKTFYVRMIGCGEASPKLPPPAVGSPGGCPGGDSAGLHSQLR